MTKQTVVSSKWVKTQILARSAALKPHIPTTTYLRRKSLLRLLQRHRMVYVKPVSGSRGIGVMRIELLGGKWVVQDGMKRLAFGSFQQQYLWLRRRVQGEAYLVQRGIYVLRLKGRPIDFRVMIQKGRLARWVVTGTAARVAHPLKAVTNGSQGGTIYPAKTLLHRIVGKQEATRLTRQFKWMAIVIARRISVKYPTLNELGIDIAVDRKIRSWILEVNTKPGPCPFTKLPDSTMLRRILRYGRRYGRTYSLKCNKARSGMK